MGSLLPGWDRKKCGPPKAMRDYEDPSKIPVSPRAAAAKSSCQQTPTDRPNLARSSCPSVLHGTVAPLHGRPGESIPVRITIKSDRPNLGRASMGGTTSPTSPKSPFAGSTPPGSLFAKLLEKGSEEKEELGAWSERVDSSALNVRPDDPKDLEQWRHGSFKVNDPLHSMHILDVETSTPGSGTAGEGRL